MILPYLLLIGIFRLIWRNKNFHKKKSVKIFFVLLCVIGLTPVLVLTIKLGINENESNFSLDRWLNSHHERVYMVDDLLLDYDLDGKTRTEVIQLLGNPTDTKYFKEANNIVYYLGDERGFIRIDSEWLVIWLDPQDKVAKYELMTD
jgi:hypothetical protein